MQRQLPSGSVRAGSGLLELGAARRGGDAAGSPARSTLHPPGHCPERLQDRQRVGAGNYKSNSSSRGIKLQRKRTSQGKKKKKQGEGGAEAEWIPVRSGHRSWKAAEVTKGNRRANKSHPQKKRRVSSGLVWGPMGQLSGAGRLHSPSEVRGARAYGWRREGRRLDAGEDAAEEGAAPGF